MNDSHYTESRETWESRMFRARDRQREMEEEAERKREDER